MKHPGIWRPRSILAVATLAALVLVGGCASPPRHAQADMPAPVSASSGAPSTPAELTVDGASSPTDAVATDTAGVLLPPQDISRTGWWVDSSLPGSGAGTIVMTGHVDDIAQGTGFAARFARLRDGDVITVTTADRQAHRYLVTRTVMSDKESTGPAGLPVAELNRRDGPETLALITCGGPFVGPPLGYRDNVVVFASPA